MEKDQRPPWAKDQNPVGGVSLSLFQQRTPTSGGATSGCSFCYLCFGRWLCNKFQADLETRALDGLTPADILKRQGPLGPVEAGRTAKAGRRRWATLSVEDGPL